MAAIYARVSTSTQEEQKTILTQILALKEYAETNGFTIVKEYRDEGWSGDSLQRPSLDELRVDAKGKVWNTLLIYDPDRLARRYSYQELLLDELREANITVIFLTTPTPKDGVERILYGVQGLFAEYERAKIAERFRLGRIRKAKEGNVVTSRAPFGYDYIKNAGSHSDGTFKHGYYQINEEEAALVKQIFEWIGNDGLTTISVVKKLLELKIPTRTGRREAWAVGTICKMVKNKTYIGQGHYNARYAVVPINPRQQLRKNKKSSYKSRPESEWIKITVPPLIDETLFEKVQVQMKRNIRDASRNTKRPYLLSGKIKCPCGYRRVGAGSKNSYYKCCQSIYAFPVQTRCKEKALNSVFIDYLVWEHVIKLMCSPQLLLEHLDKWAVRQTAEQNATGIQSLEIKVKRLREKQNRLTKAYAAGLMSLDQLKQYVDPIQNESIGLEKEIKASQDNQIKVVALPTAEDIRVVAQNAERLHAIPYAAKRKIINEVIGEVVGSKTELKIKGCIPINRNVILHDNGMNHVDTILALISNSKTVIPYNLIVKLPKGRLPIGEIARLTEVMKMPLPQ